MTLFHRDLGGAGKPVLILLHGMLGSSRNWLTAGADLAKRYHVFALDLRNHGQSPHASTMSYDEMVGDVLAWLNAQKIERATFVGHSMGGKVAMLLACRHPGRVDRLVVVDIAPKHYLWPAHRTNFAAMLELNLADVRARGDAELRLEGRIPSLSMRKFLVTNLDRKEDGTWFWHINLPVLAAALPALEKNPLAPSNRFEGPTLFLVGAKSTYVMPEDHALIRAHFPAVEIRELPGAGHNPHTETRPQFVAAVFSR